MKLINRTNGGRVVVAAFVLGMVFSIGATYERYRGTDHSRVPLRRAATGQASQPRASSLVTRMVSDSTTTNSLPSDSAAPSLSMSKSGSRSTELASSGSTDDLLLYPTIQKGMRTPFDLWRYYGRGRSSFGSPVLPMRFEQWLEFHRK